MRDRNHHLTITRLKLFILLFTLSLFVTPMVAAEAITLNKVVFDSDSLPNHQLEAKLTFSAPLTQLPSSFITQNPPRIIIDFPGIESELNPANITLNNMGVNEALVLSGQNRTRMVINLSSQLKYTIVFDPDAGKKQVNIIFGNAPQWQSNSTAPAFAVAKPEQPSANTQISKLDFRRDPDSTNGQIIVSLDNPQVKTDIEEENNNLFIKFYDTKAPTNLQRKYDVTDFGTAVQNMLLNQTGQNAELIINSKGIYDHSIYQLGNNFIINIIPADDETDANTLDKNQHYKGEKISLDFQNIPVRSVLQLLAEFTNQNMIITDSVQGNITLRLHHLPWDQALDFILQTQNLGKRQIGNILMIAPNAEIKAQALANLKTQENIDALAPLYTQSFQINYGTLDDYYKLLKDPKQTLLSSRGHVVELPASNTLIVEDTEAKLSSIQSLFKAMDIPARQVLIEARIVYVNTSYEKRLGIIWGQTGTSRIGETSFQNFAMDFGPGALSVAGGYNPATFTIGRLLGSSLLDMELQAVEAEGEGRLISSPRVMTSNNQQATISQGQQIPYQTSAPNGGTTVQLVNANLQLQVTPQITPNNKVVLNLNIQQNKAENPPPGQPNPTIDTRQLTTDILVDNNQTVVLGGIYEQTQNVFETRIPWLSSLPIIGNLFKSKVTTDVKTELLIFITPKIIDNNTNPNDG